MTQQAETLALGNKDQLILCIVVLVDNLVPCFQLLSLLDPLKWYVENWGTGFTQNAGQVKMELGNMWLNVF